MQTFNGWGMGHLISKKLSLIVNFVYMYISNRINKKCLVILQFVRYYPLKFDLNFCSWQAAILNWLTDSPYTSQLLRDGPLYL